MTVAYQQFAEERQDAFSRLAGLCQPPCQSDRQRKMGASLLPGLPVQLHGVEQSAITIENNSLRAFRNLDP